MASIALRPHPQSPETQLSITQGRIDDMNLIHAVTHEIMCQTYLSPGGCDSSRKLD